MPPSPPASPKTHAHPPALAIPTLAVSRRLPLRRTRPLPPIPVVAAAPAFASAPPSRLSTAAAEEIIDPDASSDTLVSPIVFAPSYKDQGQYGDEEVGSKAPFWFIKGKGKSKSKSKERVEWSVNGNFVSDSEDDEEKEKGNRPRNAVGDMTWGGVSMNERAPLMKRRMASARPAFGDLMWNMMNVNERPAPLRKHATAMDRLNGANGTNARARNGAGMPRRHRSAGCGTACSTDTSKPPVPAHPPGLANKVARRSKFDPLKPWVGEWNVDMQDAIKQLRLLK